MGEIIYSKNPQEVDKEFIEQIPRDVLSAGLMTLEERLFVNGLVRMTKPLNILEIGVYRGGGTCLLLNAIQDMPDSTVTSIDIANTVGDIDIADVAQQYHGGNPKWTLYKGVDPSQVIEKTGKKFDFLVLDTLHIHPIESLNFLTVFPFLTPDAVVVLHDINLFLSQKTEAFPRCPFACKLLFDTVKADKIVPKAYPDLAPNIGAFQLTEDTEKSLDDVFSMLSFPWGHYTERIDDIEKIVSKYYSAKQRKIFRDAVANNVFLQWCANDYAIELQDRNALLEKATSLSRAKTLVLYGSGGNAKNVLLTLRDMGRRLPDEIWDIRAEADQTLDAIPIVKPAFEQLSQGDYALICSIGNVGVCKEIFEECVQHGFENYSGLELFLALADDPKRAIDKFAPSVYAHFLLYKSRNQS